MIRRVKNCLGLKEGPEEEGGVLVMPIEYLPSLHLSAESIDGDILPSTSQKTCSRCHSSKTGHKFVKESLLGRYKKTCIQSGIS